MGSQRGEIVFFLALSSALSISFGLSVWLQRRRVFINFRASRRRCTQSLGRPQLASVPSCVRDVAYKLPYRQTTQTLTLAAAVS